jgi:hypothetical protein
MQTAGTKAWSDKPNSTLEYHSPSFPQEPFVSDYNRETNQLQKFHRRNMQTGGMFLLKTKERAQTAHCK